MVWQNAQYKNSKQGWKEWKETRYRLDCPSFLFSYRITPHAKTGLSPTELMMSWRLRSVFDMLMPDIKSKVQNNQLTQKETQDTNRKLRSFAPGDNVSIRNYSYGRKWIPIDVQYASGLLSYTVAVGKGKFIKRHWNQVSSRLANIVPLSETAGGTVSLTTTGGAPEELSVERTVEVKSFPDGPKVQQLNPEIANQNNSSAPMVGFQRGRGKHGIKGLLRDAFQDYILHHYSI